VDKVNRVQRQWSRTAARRGKLGIADVAPWLAAVHRLIDEQQHGTGARGAAYLEFLLLTALRRREAAYLKWADVDLRRGTLTVRETKNHLDHTLPITKRVREILLERKQETGDKEHVFGGAEVRHQLVRIERETGIWVGPHDLRRSWASFADKVGVGAYAIKGALNHLSTGDVTGTNYVTVDLDDLREPMQRVEDYILRLARPPADNVVTLRGTR
jgi:integrase